MRRGLDLSAIFGYNRIRMRFNFSYSNKEEKKEERVLATDYTKFQVDSTVKENFTKAASNTSLNKGADYISNSIYDAVASVSENAVSAVQSDVSYEMEVMEIVDQGTATYRVKYLENDKLQAHASTPSYSVGDHVLVLVPRGDFDNPLVILNSVTPSVTVVGEDKTTAETVKRIEVSQNLFNSYNLIKFASYQDETININDIVPYDLSDLLKGYFDSGYNILKLNMNVKTSIAKEQRISGSYGIKVEIPIRRKNADGILKDDIQEFYLDSKVFNGNPYELTNWSNQTNYLVLNFGDEIVFDKKKSIKVTAFIDGFPQDPAKTDKNVWADIVLKDIQLTVCEDIETVEGGYKVVLTAENGPFFANQDVSSIEEKKINLKVFLNGLETSYAKMPVYWFIEDPTVNETSKYYHRSAGVNWRCLNSRTEVLGEAQNDSSFVFDTSAGSIIISNQDIKYKSKIRCYVGTNEGQLWVYGELAISNLYSLIKEVNLYADKENNTYVENVGNVILTCEVNYPNLYSNVVHDEELNYVWEQIDQQGRIVSQDDFYSIVALNDKNITDGIYTTKISFPVSSLTSDMNIFKVYVYVNKKQASGSITAYPIETKQISIRTKEGQDFLVVLDNANVNYNYDADGDAPDSDNYDGLSLQKLEIKPVEFSIISAATGEEISNAEYDRVSWVWKVPINSLLKPNLVYFESINQDNTSAITKDDNYYYIRGNGANRSLQYKLASRYNAKSAQSLSSLTITFGNTVLYEDVPIRFSKDGENGTNGTKYTAFVTYKIGDTEYRYGDIYVDDNGNEHPVKMRFVAVEDDDGTIDWYIYDLVSNTLKKCYSLSNNNYSHIKGDLYRLNVKVYKDGEEINTSASSQTGQANVSWSIFDSGEKQGLGWKENKYFCPFAISDSDSNSCYIIPTNSDKNKLSQWTNENNIPYVIVQANISLSNLKATADQSTDDLNNIYNNDLHIYYDYPIEITRIKKPQTDFASDGSFKSFVPSLEGGFYNVLYTSAGNNPQYDDTENFRCESNLIGVDSKECNYSWNANSNIFLDKNMTIHEISVSEYNECPVAKPNPLFQSGDFYNYIKVKVDIENKILKDKLSKTTSEKEELQKALDKNNLIYSNLELFLKACNLYQIEYSLKQSKEELQKRSECIDALQNIVNAINNLDRDVSAQSNMSELTLSNGIKIGSSKNVDTFIYNELNIINNIIISVLNTKTSVYGIGYNGGNDIESISSLFEDVFSRISTLYGNGIRTIIRKDVNVLQSSIDAFNTFNQSIKNKTVTTNYSDFTAKLKKIVENENLVELAKQEEEYQKLLDTLNGYYVNITEYVSGNDVEKNYVDIWNSFVNFKQKLYSYGREIESNEILEQRNQLSQQYALDLNEIESNKENTIISSEPIISYQNRTLSGKKYSEAKDIVQKRYEELTANENDNCSKEIAKIKANKDFTDEEKGKEIAVIRQHYAILTREKTLEKDNILKTLADDVKNTKIKSINSITEKYNTDLLKTYENSYLVPLQYLQEKYSTKTSELNTDIKNKNKEIADLNIGIESSQESVIIIRPINMKCNSYEIPGLNNWDGKKYYLSNNGEYMFCPQIGAGVKTNNNTFTGMFMGARTSVNRSMVSETENDLNLRNKDIGLFGYSQGVQSIFLDAKTGSAFMGMPGQGQIVISPDQAFASIYSGNYYKYDSNRKGYYSKKDGSFISEIDFNNLKTQEERDNYSSGQGMLINLTDGAIKSSYWNVNSEGKSTFTSGVIGGWEIGANTLSSVIKNNAQLVLDSGNSVGLTDVNGSEGRSPKIYSSDNTRKPHDTLNSMQPGFYLSSDGLSIGNTFKVSTQPATGLKTQGTGILEVGNLSGAHWTIGQNLEGTSFIGYGASYLISKSFVNTNNDNSANDSESVYLGTDGLSFGRNLELKSNGSLKIGRFTKNGLLSNFLVLEVDEGDSSNASLRFNTNSIHDFKNNSLYVGTQGIRLGKQSLKSNNRGVFEVENDGTLWATAGHIANWTLDEYQLLSTNTVVVDGVTKPGLVLDSRKGYIAFIKEGFDKTTKGFYIGNEGLSLGDSFWVDRTGQLSATKGNIANWTIDKNSLYVKTSATDGSLVKLFDIHPTTSGGYIAYNTTGWNTGRLLNNIEGCFYLGTSGISLGEGPTAPFRVNNKGYLWSTSGVIGGWTISNTSLKGGNVTLNSDGSIRGSGWSFSTAGVLTCNDAIIGGVHFKTGSGEANWSGGQMTSGQIGGWTITTSSIYDTANSGGNVRFDTSGNFNILTDGESGIKGTGGDISMKGATKVTASSGGNKMEITNTSGSFRVGSFGLSIGASETSLSGSSKLRLSGGNELYLSSPKAIFNASGENIMIGSSTTLKAYIESVVNTVLKSKTIDFKTNTVYTGETEGHKHTYTKVVSATIS